MRSSRQARSLLNRLLIARSERAVAHRCLPAQIAKKETAGAKSERGSAEIQDSTKVVSA